MPVPFTAAEMKAWFETGDIPTQQQFADLIDTLLHQVQQASDTADAAVAASAKATKCYGLVTFTYVSAGAPGVVTMTVNRVEGCSAAAAFAGFMVSGNGTITLTITPDTAFDDTSVTVLAQGDDGVTVPTAITRNLGTLVLSIPIAFSAVGATKKFNLLVMP